MRIPLVIGLLLVLAWTTHAQSGMEGPPPQQAVTTSTTTATALTASASAFDFYQFNSGAERIYVISDGPNPTVHISKSSSSYDTVQLYIRMSDGDSVADTIGAGSSPKYMTITSDPTGQDKNITLNFVTIASSNITDHLLFFALTSSTPGTAMSGSVVVATSPLFGVANNKTDEASLATYDTSDLANSASASIQTVSSTISSTAASGTAASNNAPNAAAGSPSSKGLAAGAIAGIAVGAAVVLIIIIAAIWCMMRHRKRQARSHTADATTPLAAGYGRVAAAVGSRDLIAEKEAGAMVAESPQAQTYTDHFDPRHSATLSGAVVTSSSIDAPATASYPERGHQAYDDVGRSLTDPQPPHGSASSGRGLDSPVPDIGVTRHLVDDDMTADEIARLEEEERELDRQIQEAGRRRR